MNFEPLDQPAEFASLPAALLIGLRQALESGIEPEDLAERLGPLIDVMWGDIERIRQDELQVRMAAARNAAAERTLARQLQNDNRPQQDRPAGSFSQPEEFFR